MKQIMLCALLMLAGFFAACSSTDITPREDSIAVQQVRATLAAGSPYVIVTATISYTLASADEARLTLGLDSETPGKIRIVAEKLVARGSGTLTLSAEIEKKSDRKIMSAIFSLDQMQRGPGHPPLAYRRSSLEYPK